MTLRRVLSCFIWVSLLVAPGGAEAKGRSAALQEALDHATVIAIGQMESLDLRGERRLVTLRVEHVARGELPDVITFDAEPPQEKRASRELSRVLVFLEPTSQQTPRFRLSLGGAASLRIVSRPAGDRMLFVADASWADLCGPHSTKRGCQTPLDRFLRDAGLRPFTPRQEATFRVYQPTQCGPCELEGYVQKRIAPDSRDCGLTAEWEPDPRVLQCMRESLTAQTPFHMRIQRRGIDAQIVDAYVSDGPQVLGLSFHSSTSGGSPCTARVSQRRCVSFAFPGTDEVPLRCENPEPDEKLCEQSRTVYSLGPAEQVSRLTCVPRDGPAWRCEVNPGRTLSGGRVPRSTGPDLVCTQSGQSLSCHEQ